MQNKPRLIFLLNSAQRHLQQWIAQQTDRLNRGGAPVPSPAQSGVVFALGQADGATMGELALALDLAHAQRVATNVVCAFNQRRG